MADKVHITKRGIQALKWDSDVRQYVEATIQSGLHVLRCACHIDAGVCEVRWRPCVVPAATMLRERWTF
jgi:hypothetical protein